LHLDLKFGFVGQEDGPKLDTNHYLGLCGEDNMKNIHKFYTHTRAGRIGCWSQNHSETQLFVNNHKYHYKALAFTGICSKNWARGYNNSIWLINTESWGWSR